MIDKILDKLTFTSDEDFFESKKFAFTSALVLSAWLHSMVPYFVSTHLIHKEEKQTTSKSSTNVFNVYDSLYFTQEPYSHVVVNTYMFSSENNLADIDIPDGYEIQSYDIQKVENKNIVKYLYTVTFINTEQVRISGYYDSKVGSVVFNKFGRIEEKTKKLSK